MRRATLLATLLAVLAPVSGYAREGGQGTDSVPIGVAQSPDDGQAAAAQSPDEARLEAQTRAVASQLRCPICQGLSVEDSPTELAREMRAVVKDQLSSGQSAEDVKAYFVSKYGEWILLRPQPRGLNLAVYLLPVLALLIGGAVIAGSVRRWTRSPAGSDGIDG